MQRSARRKKIRAAAYANIATALAGIVAVAALLGWIFDIELLKRPARSAPAMNPLTAVTMLIAVSSIGLFVYHRKSRRRHLATWAGRFGALLTGSIGLAKLTAVVIGFDLRIDHWLFASKLAKALPVPNEMAPNTAFNFLMLGFALTLLHFRNRRVSSWAFVFALVCGLEALLVLMGYSYRVSPLYGIGSYLPMAVTTAVAFLLLACSVAMHTADRRFGFIISGRSAGRNFSRHLLPAAVLVPAVLGWLRIEGQRMGFYDEEFGVALYTLTIMIVFAALVCRNAFSVFRTDKERTKAELRLRRAHDELEARVAERTEELSNANLALRKAWGELEERVRERTSSLAETEARLHAIVDNAPSVIYVKDISGRFVLVNQSFATLLCVPKEQIIGRQGHDLYPPAAAEEFRRNDMLALQAGEAVESEETLVQGDGVHTFISSKFPLVDAAGNIYGLCGVSTDITDRKRAGKALQDAKEEAERANRAKSEFLSRMSHELRTPMNAILGFAQLLQMDKLTPQQHDGVGHILRGGEHLLKLINEVLDIARIEAGRISLSCEPVEIAGVIRETLELVGPLASERNVGLINSVTEGNFILVDRQRFKQVLINLVSNAIKYNRLDGTVTLKCEMTESRGRVTISDTGLGIAPARLKHLFTPFERLGAEHSAVEGTGLGLTVAKRFVEAMAGTIDVESQPGEGTTFLIDFPRAESSLKTVATIEDLPEIETNGCSRPRTVLYIEDNLSNFTLLERLLERRPSTRLIAAKNGLEGLTMARKHRPDLILLDVNLPDINGHDVLVCVHADPSCASIPVIVVSADATSRQIDRLMSAGAADYITKPLDVKKFLTVLDQVLPAGAERN